MNGFGSEGLCQSHVMDSLGAKVAVEVPGFGLVVAAISGLSNEVRDRLERFRPQTVGQASRLEGVTPASMSLLLTYLKKEEESCERVRE